MRPFRFATALACPICQAALAAAPTSLHCIAGDHDDGPTSFPIIDGFPDLVVGDRFDDETDDVLMETEEQNTTHTVMSYWAPLFRRIAPDGRPLKVLSVGCGAGLEVDLLRAESFDCVGIDNGNRTRAWSRRKSTDALAMANAMRLPFEDGQFDVAFCGCVFPHVGVAGDSAEVTAQCWADRLRGARWCLWRFADRGRGDGCAVWGQRGRGYLGALALAYAVLVGAVLMVLPQPYLVSRLPAREDRGAILRFVGATTASIMLGTISGRADLLFLTSSVAPETLSAYASAVQLASIATLLAGYASLTAQPLLIPALRDGRGLRFLVESVGIGAVLGGSFWLAVYVSGAALPEMLFGRSAGGTLSGELLTILAAGTALDLICMPVAMTYALQVRP